jgi:hypothetical protein
MLLLHTDASLRDAGIVAGRIFYRASHPYGMGQQRRKVLIINEL